MLSKSYATSGLLALAAVAAVPALAAAQPAEVEIVNPLSAPGNVINPADSLPFVETVYVVAGANDTSADGTFSVVPAGYRLIIDHIAVGVTTPSAQRAWAYIRPCPNIKGNAWGITPIMTSLVPNADGDNMNLGVTAMHLYADPTCVPAVLALRNGKTGSFGGHITLHGHYARIAVSRQ
ncbi:MAG TPA: hypothetical protein VM261_28915 [Kofleriaceae bacterium]|nr:hypothetical protein [Kofleriaceae bacterium]